MNRRTVLKNLSLGLGYTIAAPSIFGLLSSCKTETNTWLPSFFSSDEKHLVTNLSDIILPSTNTPGALDVNVPQFIDLVFSKIETETNKKMFKTGANNFAKTFKNQFNVDVIKGSKKEFESHLDNYFNISKNDKKEIDTLINGKVNEIKQKDLERYSIYKFLLWIKYYTIFGYFTSEEVGENVLNYDPIPGVHNGCLPLEDVPNKRLWS
ncbi:gluconate 2-dehydrogenase subunit 3 family protein [Polaribacter sp.]|uniref:gluconate 2-dehydrogenase subunit 3 family protein n=1 Tax=Polaribacter sp. TaxID=1920175 RepID=UPI003F6A16FC